MADHPFANAGLGMFGAAENQFAKSAMQGGGGGDGSEFLGGLLSFMGVGQETQDKVKDFAKNPVAAMGPQTTRDMYGVSPNAMGPAMPPKQLGAPVVPNASSPMYQNGSDMGGGFNPSTISLGQISAKPTLPTFDQQLEQQRQQTQDILGRLIPRNLSNTPQ